MERWSGKVAVVTGASSGIGACIAKRLVKAGVIVVGMARRAELITELANHLTTCKGKLYAKKVDLTNRQEIIDAFDWIGKNLGPVQILVNNAGVATGSTLLDGEFNQWQTLIDTNLTAVAICCKEALKVMQEGHIVIINSVAGNRILPLCHIYGPTKYALTAYGETLRHEITAAKLRVKITSVHPGIVETAMINGSALEESCAHWPRLDPEAVADSVLYAIGTPQEVQITQLTIQALGEVL